MKTDLYDRVTAHIMADLEQGVRPWFKPWNAENLAGRISRPRRANGVGYRGINVLMLWAVELVAELGAALLCPDLGLSPQPREEHASYLAHWLAVLKADHRAIFTAATHAQRAADFLHELQPDAQEVAA